jgi:hypothetical protein
MKKSLPVKPVINNRVAKLKIDCKQDNQSWQNTKSLCGRATEGFSFTSQGCTPTGWVCGTGFFRKDIRFYTEAVVCSLQRAWRGEVD